MKTPLPFHEEMLPALLATGWGVKVAMRPLFIPIGDSAYSYRVEAVAGEQYYLKVVDRRTVAARQLAARMRRFSLPLQRYVAELEAISRISARALVWKQQLRELVAPRLEMIRRFMARAEQYAERVQQMPQQVVVCHGDPWGGNMIPAGAGRLIFLDWESAAMAPVERDALVYLSDPSRPEFWAFVQGYQQTRGEPVQWQPVRLAYHAYRQQLRNLAHWLHQLLHERLDEQQRANDLEMIGFHCLDRWEGIEQATTRLAAALI